MDYLPNEVLLLIFKYVPLKLLVRRVCKKFWNLYDSDKQSLYPLCSNLENIKLVENLGMKFTIEVYNYAANMDLPILISRHRNIIHDKLFYHEDFLMETACRKKSQQVAYELIKESSKSEFINWIKLITRYNLEDTFMKLAHIKLIKDDEKLLCNLSYELAYSGYSDYLYICKSCLSSESKCHENYTIKLLPEVVIAIISSHYNLLPKLIENNLLTYVLYHIVLVGETTALDYLETSRLTGVPICDIGNYSIELNKFKFIKWVVLHKDWVNISDRYHIMLIVKALEYNRFEIFKALFEHCNFVENDIYEWSLGGPLEQLALLWINSDTKPIQKQSAIEVFIKNRINELLEEE